MKEITNWISSSEIIISITYLKAIESDYASYDFSNKVDESDDI